MGRTLLKRTGELLAVLLIVSFGTFILVSLLPNDTAVSILGPGRAQAEYDGVREELCLNEPLLLRYLDWLGSALTGDLGTR